MNGRFDSPTVGAKAWSFAAMLSACALVLALAGPFGQAERFLPSQRIGLWVLYLAAGLPVLAMVVTGLRRWFGGHLLAFVSAVAAGLPVLLIVETIGLIEGRPLPATGFDWLRSGAEVAVLCVPFAILLERFMRPAEAKSAIVMAPVIAADVHAVCAEGHYTRLFSPRGEQFLDHSFSNVLKALGDRDGAQVHRSWWVARGAVEGLQRKGSAIAVRIKGGVDVPVARRRLTKLRGEGWPI